MNIPQLPKSAATGAYKHIGDDNNNPVTFDLYLPSTTITESVLTLPTVVYFHGGGLTIGEKTWIPTWLLGKLILSVLPMSLFDDDVLCLLERVMSLGYAFISANYQLLCPGTTHDIIQDVQDLFKFLENTNIALDENKVFRADMNKVAVSGSSSGGHCAYLAAIHCVPRPKALFAMYPAGGSFFTPFYLKEKTEPFLMNRPLLDPASLVQFLYPFPGGSKVPISESPMTFDQVTKAPNNIRMSIRALHIQLAVALDHYTGLHEPSLSAKLRGVLENNPQATRKDFEEAVPVSQRHTFPELNVSSSWPPTLCIHGDADTAVLLSESEDMTKLLVDAGVDASLIIAPGQEHMFDLDPRSEKLWGKQYDATKDFLFKYLGEA